VRKEVLGEDWGVSTSSVPRVEDHIVPEKLIEKVSTLIKLLKSCVDLMKDETALNTLYDMIDHCTRGRETPISQRMINRVFLRKRNNEEFRFSA
jgi:hypothetical protein